MYQKIDTLNEEVRSTIQKIDCTKHQLINIVCRIHGTTITWIKESKDTSISKESLALVILVGILKVKFNISYRKIGEDFGKTKASTFGIYKRFVNVMNNRNNEPYIFEALENTLKQIYRSKDTIYDITVGNFSSFDYPRMITYISNELKDENVVRTKKLLSVMALLSGQSPREIELNFFVNANDITTWALEIKKEASK
jgi:hypothetical protein